MAREQRKDVDYFPHSCNHGIALHVIETKYGNDGYCAFYRLNEQLGKAPNHYIKISNEMTFMYLVSALKVSDEDANDIISDLIKLEYLDKYLYEEYKVLWSKEFIDSVTDAYRNRAGNIFQYDDVLNEIEGKNKQSSARLPHKTPNLAEVIPKEKKRIVKKRKVKEIEGEESKNSRFLPPSQSEVEEYFSSKINETFWSDSECVKEAKKFVDFYTSKNWFVGKNKMKIWKSAASGWINRKEEFASGKTGKSIEQKKSGVDAALTFGEVKMRDDENGN